MSRSVLLTIMVVAVIGSAVTLRTSRTAPEAEAPVPSAPVRYDCEGCSVLLISIDTLRADHLGCYGYERPTSPSIDCFAAAGLFALPFGLSLAIIAAKGGPLAIPLAAFAVASAAVGVLVERWLFFAEAKHVVTLYYGTESA